MNKTIIIGLGHKGRQGKDYSSGYMMNALTNCKLYVLHFADELYKEVKNEERILPLIKYEFNQVTKEREYLIQSRVDKDGIAYQRFDATTLPQLQRLFQDSNGEIVRHEYWGMNKKDAELLQFWGTDFRRKLYGDDYWVNKVKSRVEEIQKEEGIKIILIPDTRFKNEHAYIKSLENGYYIDVMRFKHDGSHYIAQDRDPNHPSEIELDEVKPDFTIVALDGCLGELNNSALDSLKGCIKKSQVDFRSIIKTSD